eukprot:502430-Pyramimonas_sp.AAC.1
MVPSSGLKAGGNTRRVQARQLMMLLYCAQVLLLRPPVPHSSPPSSAEASLGGAPRGHQSVLGEETGTLGVLSFPYLPDHAS